MIENDKKAIQVGPISALVVPGRKKKCHVSTLMSLTGERRTWKTFSFSAFYRKKKKKKKFHTYLR
jgi:hypothetical protein